MSMQTEREVPLLMQRKQVATLNEYTGKPVMKSARWAYESAAGGLLCDTPTQDAVAGRDATFFYKRCPRIAHVR